MIKSSSDNCGVPAPTLNFRLLVLFCIALDIFIIMAGIPAWSQENNSQQEKAVKNTAVEVDTLNKKELLQLRKDALLSELALRRSSSDTHSNVKWQLRLLFATFSVIFFFLCVTSREFKKANIPGLVQVFITFVLIVIFFLYDSHVSDLMDRMGKRVDKISDILKALPELSYKDLLEIETHVNISTSNNRLGNLWRKISQLWEKPFDFFLFYAFILLTWVMGWIFYAKNLWKSKIARIISWMRHFKKKKSHIKARH